MKNEANCTNCSIDLLASCLTSGLRDGGSEGMDQGEVEGGTTLEPGFTLAATDPARPAHQNRTTSSAAEAQ